MTLLEAVELLARRWWGRAPDEQGTTYAVWSVTGITQVCLVAAAGALWMTLVGAGEGGKSQSWTLVGEPTSSAPCATVLEALDRVDQLLSERGWSMRPGPVAAVKE